MNETTGATFPSNRFEGLCHPYRENNLYEQSTFADWLKRSASMISSSDGWPANRVSRIYYEAYAMNETFVNALSLSAVVYIRNLNDYGWFGLGPEYDRSEGPASGYEAYSPRGEARAFATYQEANEWRLSEVRAYVNASI